MGNDWSKWNLFGPMSKMASTDSITINHNGYEEEKELKKKLLDLNMYESGMTEKEMKLRMQIVDDSKNQSANIGLHSINDSTSQSNSIDEIPSPSSPRIDRQTTINFSNKLSNCVSSNQDEIIDFNRNSGSERRGTESAMEIQFDMANTTNSVCDRKNAEKHTNSRHLPSPTSTRNIYSKTTSNCNRSSKSLDNINVFAFKILPNDVPLNLRYKPVAQKKFEMLSSNIPKIPDEIFAEKKAYLNEMANLARSWKSKLVCNEFSWGPPIKVGIANESLDQFTIREEVPGISILSPNQLRMRKGSNLTEYLLRPKVEKKDVYEYCDDDFEDPNKRKKEPKIPINRIEVISQNHSKKCPNRGTGEEPTTSVQSVHQIPANDIELTNTLLNGRKRIKSPSPEYPEQSQKYPRRIVPPIPSTATKSNKKMAVAVPRTKKKNTKPEYNIDENNLMKSTVILSEKEIEKSLMGETNDEPEIVNFIEGPILRLNRSMKNLKKAKLELEEKNRKLEEESKLLAERELRERTEKVQARIKQREEKKEQEEMEEKLRKDKEEWYRNMMNSRKVQGHIPESFQKIVKLNSECPRVLQTRYQSTSKSDGLQTPASNEIDMFPDDEYGILQSVEPDEKSQCPICGHFFPLIDIENHAGNCNDFVQNSPKTNDHIHSIASTSIGSQSEAFLCSVCQAVLRDKQHYEQHVRKCIQSLTDEGPKGADVTASNDFSRKKIIATKNSDLEINQTENRVIPRNKNKTVKFQNRKRKR